MEGGVERLVAELAEQVRGRFYGKYRGIVKEVDDGDKQLGRIKALVPEVLGDEVSPWALPCAPFAGDGMGQFTLPPKEAGVWIEFEAGDPARPIWNGGWWGRNQTPKNENGKQAKPGIKVIRSEKGMMVSMDDDAQTVSLSDEKGKNILTIEVQGGKITVKGATKAVVEAPQIELVENATHPVVFGDELMNYLNQIVQLYQSHTHPGEMALGVFPVTPAPPVPPLTPPPPTLISKKVKSG
ncbi:phage baseplate assembly protein V [Halomonas cerina]|uniref:Gp5/Type VI secretion system Vgr protein OB-fold domain-containing protein n=1 Tax=Halomonas cerina TaxID=447424 RepID=A0A839VET0_9GAMM|nr:phage baseplate assembly protein V [Halomonas cerina]MBB3191869.1 hypothetical protein [Halomonas cerina]